MAGKRDPLKHRRRSRLIPRKERRVSAFTEGSQPVSIDVLLESMASKATDAEWLTLVRLVRCEKHDRYDFEVSIDG